MINKLKTIKLYILSTLTAISIKLFNKYLTLFYFTEFEKYREDQPDESTLEIIGYIEDKIAQGAEVYIHINQSMADNTIGFEFVGGDEEDELPPHLHLLSEDDDKGTLQ